MIFNSLEFFVFLPIVLLVYSRLRHKQQNIWLLIASYVFYGWWDPRFLYLISISTTIDFFCGKLIDRPTLEPADIRKGLVYLFGSCLVFLGLLGWNGDNSIEILVLGLIAATLIIYASSQNARLSHLGEEKRRKIALAISMCANLGLLGVFKYFNFFVESAESALLSFGMSETSLVHLNIILPVGISFYTFQTMSYSIDIYRKKLKPCESFIDFALFVSFFPQLVAGPIERATNLLPKIIQKRTITWSHLYSGAGLIAFGLFKKVVIADGVSASVASIYGTSGAVSWVDITAATLLFTIQIYCDFSGYSDIARGTSKLLGIDLMRNFNFPYFSRSPSEFWNRWHISLSSWLRDYLYISLGGNRKGKWKTYRNLFLTMILGGLWHGAAWNFVLWGAYQGSLLCLYRFFIPDNKTPNRQRFAFVKFWLSLTVFFLFTMYGWLLFRAESFEQIVSFTSILFTEFSSQSLSMKIPPLATLVGIPILVFYEIHGYTRDQAHPEASQKIIEPVRSIAKAGLFGLMMFLFVGALSTPPTAFIYFQF